MTDGLLVLVQLVIAAITTAPCVMSLDLPLFFTVAWRARAASSSPKPRSATLARSADSNDFFMPASGTRSCGRFGPANDGSTVFRSSFTVVVNLGGADDAVRNNP